MASFDDRKQASRRADIGPGDKYGWHHAPGSFYLPYKILRSWLYDSFLYEVDSPLYEKCTYESDPSILYTCHFEPHVSCVLSLHGPRCVCRGSSQVIAHTRNKRTLHAVHNALSLSQNEVPHCVLLYSPHHTGGDSHPHMHGCVNVCTVTVGTPPAGISSRSLQVVSDLCLDTLLVGDAQPTLFSGIECVISTIGFAYNDIPTHAHNDVIVCSELSEHAVLTATLGWAHTYTIADGYVIARGNLLVSASSGSQQTWIDTGVRRSLLYKSIPSVYRFRDAAYKGLSSWTVSETIPVGHIPDCGYAIVGCFNSFVPARTHVADTVVLCGDANSAPVLYPPAVSTYTHGIGGCLSGGHHGYQSTVYTQAYKTSVPYTNSDTWLATIPQPASTLDWGYPCITPEFDFCNVQVRLNAFDIAVQHISARGISVHAAVDFNSALNTTGQWQVCAYSHDPCVMEASFVEVYCTTPAHAITAPSAVNYASVCAEPIVAELCIPHWTLLGASTVLPHTKSFDWSAQRVADTAVYISHHTPFVMCGSGATGIRAFIDDNAIIIQGPSKGTKQQYSFVTLNDWVKVESGYVRPITIIGTYGDSHGVANSVFAYSASFVPTHTRTASELQNISAAEYCVSVACATTSIAVDAVYGAVFEHATLHGTFSSTVYELTASVVTTEEWGDYCPLAAISADSYEFTNCAPLRPAYDTHSASMLGGDVYTAPMPTTKSICWFPATPVGTLSACTHGALVSIQSVNTNVYIATDIVGVRFQCTASVSPICAQAADEIDMTCTERLAPVRVMIDWWRAGASRSVLYRQGDEAILSVPDSVYKGFYGVQRLRREHVAHVIESVITPYFDCNNSRCDKFSISPSELPVSTGSIIGPDRRTDSLIIGTSGMPMQYRADNWYGFAAVYKGLSYSALVSGASAEIGVFVAFAKCGGSSGCWNTALDICGIENVMTSYSVVPVNSTTAALYDICVPVRADTSTSVCDVIVDELSGVSCTGVLFVVPTSVCSAYTIGMDAESRDNFALISGTSRQSTGTFAVEAETFAVSDCVYFVPTYNTEYARALNGVSEAAFTCHTHVAALTAHTAVLVEVFATPTNTYASQCVHTISVETAVAYFCEITVFLPAAECVADWVYSEELPSCVTSSVHVSDALVGTMEFCGVKCTVSGVNLGGIIASVPSRTVSTRSTTIACYVHAVTVKYAARAQASCKYTLFELDGLRAVQEQVPHVLADCAVICALTDVSLASCTVSYAGTVISTSIDGLEVTESSPICTYRVTESVAIIVGTDLAKCGCYHSYVGDYSAHMCGEIICTFGATYLPAIVDSAYVLEHERTSLVCGAPHIPVSWSVSADTIVGITFTSHPAHIKCNCAYEAIHLSGHLMCAVKCPIFTGIEIDAIIPTYEVKDPVFVYVPVCPEIHVHYDFQEDSATQLAFIL